ncbi:EF-hand domain-containing protein [Neotabrizicola sp. VNH66]|uniref:EF-hand domain-containing protein n=1 Tax=Neotabrizicola sp. VNH66 TaxID=3400918 RepID=UPI003C02FF49
MKRMAFWTLPLGLMLAGAALAETSPAEMTVLPEDSDASGDWSLAEMQSLWPDLTAEGFAAVDTNTDGVIDATEFQVAVTNGVLKPAEGG